MGPVAALVTGCTPLQGSNGAGIDMMHIAKLLLYLLITLIGCISQSIADMLARATASRSAIAIVILRGRLSPLGPIRIPMHTEIPPRTKNFPSPTILLSLLSQIFTTLSQYNL